MKKILFSLSCLCLIFACSDLPTGDYAPFPKEYKEHQLPAYPNVINVGQSETKPLGDEDIQMLIKFTTADNLSTVKKFYKNKLTELGYKENPSTQLKQLQEQGVPVDESNFYGGSFQNVGKVFNMTVAERNDSTKVNITFMGS